ncbi:TPA: hypothetical protein QDC20_001674 [Burkholderia aenigmatica]|uniref:hypothetical protein n=1 Tax=Burkholderia sp. AU45251 TaxID=3059204 RepID=UPI0026521BC0|nr:hypothetical protein [Burkholderia sp. AU45251]HDR9482152.1 hypothetical protein [Burkholderia aenigmatica]MDN7515213.1 hypothetical protein [Burkholderia sp. AU45251]HDR9515619.1 hypothetical protein [Burkholderia aenigmatica]HDR9590523.1 hypothetical protein [Burkholderia aenigmatica]HDR9598896.1 hypothetical protein [Burkholderia aenigmatica]
MAQDSQNTQPTPGSTFMLPPGANDALGRLADVQNVRQRVDKWWQETAAPTLGLKPDDAAQPDGSPHAAVENWRDQIDGGWRDANALIKSAQVEQQRAGIVAQGNGAVAEMLSRRLAEQRGRRITLAIVAGVIVILFLALGVRNAPAMFRATQRTGAAPSWMTGLTPKSAGFDKLPAPAYVWKGAMSVANAQRAAYARNYVDAYAQFHALARIGDDTGFAWAGWLLLNNQGVAGQQAAAVDALQTRYGETHDRHLEWPLGQANVLGLGGLPVDRTSGQRMLRDAANLPFPPAMLTLALCAAHSHVCVATDSDVYHLISSAAADNDTLAMAVSGRAMLLGQRPFHRNRGEGTQLLQMAAAQGNAFARETCAANNLRC